MRQVVHLRQLLVPFVLGSFAWAASADTCRPSPKILQELRQAGYAGVADRTDFDHNVAPFRTLRDRYPGDLFVHERYQDAVQEHGIEGHLRKLIEEYQTLQIEHPDDVSFQYLFRRALIGRNTPSAIAGLTEIVKVHPNFGPAHGALAEIYPSAAFHDAKEEKSERDRFEALCPDSSVAQLPAPLPEPSGLVDQAERMLSENGDAGKAVELANNGIRADEWRLQRIRPFDWYSVDYKRQQQRDLQAKYWKAWVLQVRAYRRTQQTEKAAELLKRMEERAASLRNDSNLAQWDALSALARLYAEGDQKQEAEQKLNSMRLLLVNHPDTARASQIEDLQRTIPQ